MTVATKAVQSVSFWSITNERLHDSEANAEKAPSWYTISATHRLAVPTERQRQFAAAEQICLGPISPVDAFRLHTLGCKRRGASCWTLAVRGAAEKLQLTADHLRQLHTYTTTKLTLHWDPRPRSRIFQGCQCDACPVKPFPGIVITKELLATPHWRLYLAQSPQWGILSSTQSPSTAAKSAHGRLSHSHHQIFLSFGWVCIR
ncbi:hypothetical protein CI102_13951 [Trichoderma harzianum]|nr:hypothetical protein CI102_13951 [Trichoderma harzianum]